MTDTKATYAQWDRWMQTAQQGDQVAYRSLLHALLPWAQRAIWRKAPYFSESEREDVGQEFLLSLHKVRHTWSADKPLVPWLRAILHHKVVDAVRRRCRQQPEQPNFEENALETVTFLSDSANDSSEQHARKALLDQALSQLPAKQRQIVVAAKIEGLSLEEIAVQHGQSLSAIKVSIHRSTKKLQDYVTHVEKQS